MSVPGGLESTGNQKCPSLLFHSEGKKNRRADQSVGMRRGMLPARRPQWTPGLTATSTREKASHCPVTELTVQGGRRKHPCSVAPTRPWLRTDRPAKPNNSPDHVRPEIVHHSKPSTSRKRYACLFSALGEALTGAVL
ncbi:Hydroxyacylglutathione hydrolase mitochondrial [Dissostichus eleginoides]|uniref:Hydroxyacylglutathione hydrolase mitochondrial n=1 Tax=Dissostichus eleginoides TaxID=100907 RepID=A0AAD9F4D9_DISEL|nr:Hydroxyacylglutathione hydrolase mitochondrial [Dissostichus eleginoides]